MSDRIKGLTVYFEKPVHEDYAVKLCEAISWFKYVSKVKPEIANHVHYFAVAEARYELQNKIFELLNQETEK